MESVDILPYMGYDELADDDDSEEDQIEEEDEDMAFGLFDDAEHVRVFFLNIFGCGEVLNSPHKILFLRQLFSGDVL